MPCPCEGKLIRSVLQDLIDMRAIFYQVPLMSRPYPASRHSYQPGVVGSDAVPSRPVPPKASPGTRELEGAAGPSTAPAGAGAPLPAVHPSRSSMNPCSHPKYGFPH